MLRIASPPWWASILSRRLTTEHFRRAGLPTPAFFIGANTEDNALGRVADIVSGVVASPINTPSYPTLVGSGVDSPAGSMHTGVPVVTLGADGGLIFSGIGDIFKGADTVVLSCAIVCKSTPTANFAGQPTTVRHTLISRSFLNPGGTNTAMSGWQLGLHKYKTNISDTSYGYLAGYIRGATAATTKVESPTVPVSSNIFSAGSYPLGDFVVKSFTIVLRKPVGASVPLANALSLFGTHTPVLVGAGNVGGLPVLFDEPGRDLLVGCAKDEATNSYYTDFFGGSILYLGVWTDPRAAAGLIGHSYAYRTNSPYVHTSARCMLQRLSNPPSIHGIAPPRYLRTHYVSNTRNAEVLQLQSGVPCGEGNYVRIAGRVFLVMRGGTPKVVSALTAVRRVSTHAIGTVDGSPPLLLREVTGTLPYVSAGSLSEVCGVIGGDTLRVLSDYEYGSSIHTMTVPAPVVNYRYAPTIPVLLSFEGTMPLSVGTLRIQANGNVVIDNLQTRNSGLDIRGGGGLVTLIGCGASGAPCSISGMARFVLYDTEIKAASWLPTSYRYAFRVNGGSGWGLTYGYDSEEYNISVFNTLNANGGMSISMYGGCVSGNSPEVGNVYGGVSVYQYGVKQVHRRGYMPNTATYPGMDAGENVLSSDSAAYSSKIHRVGGVSGTPFFVDQGNRKACVDIRYDSLHVGDGYRARGITSYYGGTGLLVAGATTYPTVPAGVATNSLGRYSVALPVVLPSACMLGGKYAPAMARKYSAGAHSAIRFYVTPSILMAGYVDLVATVVYVDATTRLRRVLRTQGLGIDVPASGVVEVATPNMGAGTVELHLYQLTVRTFMYGVNAHPHLDPYMELLP